jgi:lipid II isoglutaminyl synthase (glutamine-hydrolysing)
VPFERLAARTVVATGDRCLDLSVRLHYAGVAHVMEADPVTAVEMAGASHRTGDMPPGGRVDVIGNYTAFNELLVAGAKVKANADDPSTVADDPSSVVA